VLILTFSASFGVFVAFTYKEYGLLGIDNDKSLSFIGMMGGLANGTSRFIWGFLFDKYSYKVISTIINCLLLICCIAINWTVEYEYAYMATVMLAYACYGGNYSIYPPQTVRLLGKDLGSKVYFLTFTGFSFGK
jgi:predicted MFS family arabinose efflux permease